jgi:hypothetical protein
MYGSPPLPLYPGGRFPSHPAQSLPGFFRNSVAERIRSASSVESRFRTFNRTRARAVVSQGTFQDLHRPDGRHGFGESRRKVHFMKRLRPTGFLGDSSRNGSTPPADAAEQPGTWVTPDHDNAALHPTSPRHYPETGGGLPLKVSWFSLPVPLCQ